LLTRDAPLAVGFALLVLDTPFDFAVLTRDALFAFDFAVLARDALFVFGLALLVRDALFAFGFAWLALRAGPDGALMMLAAPGTGS
jgi:hypothetical protein